MLPSRPERAIRQRLPGAAASLAALCAGLWIAGHHPLYPLLAGAGFALALGVNLWRPELWPAWLAAAMPILDAGPWTGWIVVDEFDLLVLAVIAAGHARLAWAPSGLQPWRPRILWLAGTLAVLCAIGLLRGLLDATASGAGWFQSYADPANSWRVAKSLVYALALLPMLKHEVDRSADRAFARLAGGMLFGLLLVTIAVLRERIAYPGWLDFSVPYRTVAWFWEMHVGGAAIDAYLALATPFVAWAVWRARTPLRFALAGGLALLVAYAALTTFSRGVYLATLAPLLGLALWFSGRRLGFDPGPWLRRIGIATVGVGLIAFGMAWVQALWGDSGVAGAFALQVALCAGWAWRTRHWRRGAAVVLASALMIEALVVLGAGSYMLARIAASQRDFGSRADHWQTGVGLLQSPSQWLWGLGLGRLPAHYAGAGPSREFSGVIESAGPAATGRAAGGLRLSGAPTSHTLSGLLRLTQRVPLQSSGAYRVTLDARANVPAVLRLAVCEQHLLYPLSCQIARVQITPQSPVPLHLQLQGPVFSAGPAWAPRESVFALAVLTPGRTVELRHIGLAGPDGRELLVNGDFARGLAHWFPTAAYYFLPWHIDNLILEVLIERGLSGLLALAGLVGLAAWLPFSPRSRGHGFAPFLAASICGVVLVGLVSSVMDVPRVALLFLLLAFFGALIEAAPARVGRGR